MIGCDHVTLIGTQLSPGSSTWIFITNPDFRPKTKAACVHRLYSRTWPGRALGEDKYVIGVEEKSSIQARCHCHLSQIR